MNKIAFNLIALAAAQQNVDGNSCEEQRACWSAAVVKYPSKDSWSSCAADSDCSSGHYCLQHMWAYNDQTDSGKGCWREEVCAGNGSYNMFGERTIQWFCSEE